ncbi:replicative DNA helicase [Escherichia coli]|nr:replicative DNA helicase [Escherichia coli]EHK3442757.1 replicative DNA helicase [Escherichia coli]
MTNPTNPAWRNDDLEGAVIGAFFLRGADPEVMDILATLPADVFFVRQYRDIYAGICRQARVSGVIDPVLLCNEMPELAPVITDTGRKTWVKSSLEHYVAALRRNAALRDAEKTLTEALQNLRDAHTCEAAEDALKDAQNMMTSLSTGKGVIQPVHIDDVLPEVVDRVECRNQGLEKSRALMTGIDELDAKTGGMEPGDLVFIAARPSMGKTELALDIIDKVTEQGHGVLLFTMEMANIQIGERMVSAAGGIPVSRLKSVARFEDEDWARFSQGVGRMMGRNIWMVDQANLTIDEICATTRHHRMKHPETALVVVDYLGLIKTRSTGRHDLAVGEISKGLKSLAKSGGFPLIALSQLSRGVESRPNKRPMNSDLKNSGEIEADADIILMLYRDEVYNPETQARGIAEINITKQRNGTLGTIYRRFHNGHFLPVDQESARVLSTPMTPGNPRRYSNNRMSGSKTERLF